MTCIVGLATADGRAYVGGDSCATITGTNCVVADGKVFERGAFLIGSAGGRRAMDILRYRGELPEVPEMARVEELDRLLAVEFSDAVRKAFCEAGGILKDEEKGECFNGSAVVAVQGSPARPSRIYFLDGNFSVAPVASGRWATGSGCDFALGSLASTAGKTARERIEAALKAAAEYAEGVRPPFRILPENDPQS